MPNLLALDTSSNACSVALLANGRITSQHQILPMQQTQAILPFIDELLKNQHIKLNQLHAIAFGCGPGSFTGLRIAVSVAQGLGYAANLPLIPVSSLATIAQAAYETHGWKKLLVGVDARMQEIYWAEYVIQSDGLASLVGKEILSIPEALSLPHDADWYGVGNAWQIYQGRILFEPLTMDADQLPKAVSLLALAKAKYLQQEWVSAAEALPVYLREEVAVKAIRS